MKQGLTGKKTSDRMRVVRCLFLFKESNMARTASTMDLYKANAKKVKKVIRESKPIEPPPVQVPKTKPKKVKKIFSSSKKDK